jgi:hypothetical protein
MPNRTAGNVGFAVPPSALLFEIVEIAARDPARIVRGRATLLRIQRENREIVRFKSYFGDS